MVVAARGAGVLMPRKARLRRVPSLARLRGKGGGGSGSGGRRAAVEECGGQTSRKIASDLCPIFQKINSMGGKIVLRGGTIFWLYAIKKDGKGKDGGPEGPETRRGHDVVTRLGYGPSRTLRDWLAHAPPAAAPG